LRTFCGVLAYTGCRISKALALTADRVDISNGVIVFESLKKRRTGVYRSVPIPEALVNALEFTYSIRETQKSKNRREERLWPWGRTTAWRKIKKIMTDAGIDNEAHAHRIPNSLLLNTQYFGKYITPVSYHLKKPDDRRLLLPRAYPVFLKASPNCVGPLHGFDEQQVDKSFLPP
jgi:integrase